jgi:hypothetical protein
MLRPEGTEVLVTEVPCCVRLAGESPAAVSAGAPRSRPRVRSEISGPERGVESRQGVVRRLGREQRRGPDASEPLQPRDRDARKGGMAEPIMSRRRRQTALAGRRGAGRSRGREGGTRRQPDTEQERPSPTADVRQSGGYKPTAKSHRVGRESEGLVVPVRPGETRAEGRGPALVALAPGGKGEGIAS